MTHTRLPLAESANRGALSSLIAVPPKGHREPRTWRRVHAQTISQDERVARFAETLGLASQVLATHELRYTLSAASVAPFAGVTHVSPTTETEPKLAASLMWIGSSSLPSSISPRTAS
jgi:hypothetical protein